MATPGGDPPFVGYRCAAYQVKESGQARAPGLTAVSDQDSFSAARGTVGDCVSVRVVIAP